MGICLYPHLAVSIPNLGLENALLGIEAYITVPLNYEEQVGKPRSNELELESPSVCLIQSSENLKTSFVDNDQLLVDNQRWGAFEHFFIESQLDNNVRRLDTVRHFVIRKTILVRYIRYCCKMIPDMSYIF